MVRGGCFFSILPCSIGELLCCLDEVADGCRDEIGAFTLCAESDHGDEGFAWISGSKALLQQISALLGDN